MQTKLLSYGVEIIEEVADLTAMTVQYTSGQGGQTLVMVTAIGPDGAGGVALSANFPTDRELPGKVVEAVRGLKWPRAWEGMLAVVEKFLVGEFAGYGGPAEERAREAAAGGGEFQGK